MFSAAAAAVLATILGDQVTFTTVSSKPFEGITQPFTSFTQRRGRAPTSASSRHPLREHVRRRARGRTEERAVGGNALPAAHEEVARSTPSPAYEEQSWRASLPHR